MIKSKKQMILVIGVFTLVLMLSTVTYAFFNYTRTGSANTISTGRISFTTSQETLTLTNAFPISSEDALTDTDNTAEAIITITGDTEYSEGIEYLITVEDVNVSIGTGFNTKIIPIKLDIIPEKTGDLGEEIVDYWGNRGGNVSYYKVLKDDKIVYPNIMDYYGLDNNVLIGYIAPGETGINGTIGIKAFIDKDLLAISDTYSGSNLERTYYEVNDNLTQEQVNECISILSNINATEAFCNGTGSITRYGINYTFQQVLDNGYIISNSKITQLLNAGIISELYTNGTTNEWRGSRRFVLTTEEWNSFNENDLTFKIKVEANEGIWVENVLNCEGEVEPISQTEAIFSGIYNMILLDDNYYRLKFNYTITTDPTTGNETIEFGSMGLYDENGIDVIDTIIFDKIVVKFFDGDSLEENIATLEFKYISNGNSGYYSIPSNFTVELGKMLRGGI